jgi:hypothetical protein
MTSDPVLVYALVELCGPWFRADFDVPPVKVKSPPAFPAVAVALTVVLRTLSTARGSAAGLRGALRRRERLPEVGAGRGGRNPLT